MKILSVMGTRPNFMKLAPLHRAMSHYPDIQSILVHTGQHYDRQMSEVFFEQLSLPKPDWYFWPVRIIQLEISFAGLTWKPYLQISPSM